MVEERQVLERKPSERQVRGERGEERQDLERKSSERHMRGRSGLRRGNFSIGILQKGS